MKKHPATREEKRAFLKAEGWQEGGRTYNGFKLSPDSWLDPVSGSIYGRGLLEQIYHLAKRRKAARERAALAQLAEGRT